MPINYEKRQHVAYITINNPKKAQHPRSRYIGRALERVDRGVGGPRRPAQRSSPAQATGTSAPVTTSKRWPPFRRRIGNGTRSSGSSGPRRAR